jgi:DNA polymerase III epsilon subunit-like protein
MTFELVILDTETANLRGAPRLLELGALRFVDGVECAEFHALVRPGLPIDPAATAIHGIREEDLVLAEDLPSALERFDRWRGQAPLVAHNACFDARVLADARQRCGLAASAEAWYDSLKLARSTVPDALNHRLATLVRHFALGLDPPHRALADARACAAVVRACLEHVGLPAATPPWHWPGRASKKVAPAGRTAPAR